jgi:hypothetical protein
MSSLPSTQVVVTKEIESGDCGHKKRMCAERGSVDEIGIENGRADKFLFPERQLWLTEVFKPQRTCMRAITLDSTSTVLSNRWRIAALQRGSITS